MPVLWPRSMNVNVKIIMESSAIVVSESAKMKSSSIGNNVYKRQRLYYEKMQNW